MPVSDNDIKEGLSYAYLHAVAHHAGIACQKFDRVIDGMKYDALLLGQEQFAPDSVLDEVEIYVQLKATSRPHTLANGKYSFPLEVDAYKALSTTRSLLNKILVLFFLPENKSDWLNHTEDGLLSRRCAYWVSLRGAPQTNNATNQTIYVPKVQSLCPSNLRELMTRLSKREEVRYA